MAPAASLHHCLLHVDPPTHAPHHHLQQQQQLAPRAAFSNPTTPMGGTPLGGSPDGSLPSPMGSRLSDPHLPPPAMQQVPEQQQLCGAGSSTGSASVPEATLHNLAQGVRQQGGGHLHPHLHLHHHTQQPQQQPQRSEAAGQDRPPGRWLSADAAAVLASAAGGGAAAAADGGGGFAGGGRSWESNDSGSSLAGRMSRFAAAPRQQQQQPRRPPAGVAPVAVRGFSVAPNSSSSSSQGQGGSNGAATGSAAAGSREREREQQQPAGFGSVGELERPLLDGSDGGSDG